jgi:hypothetical protein
VAITPAVEVAVQNDNGRTVTGSAAYVTMGIYEGSGDPVAVLGGSLTRAAVEGVATFDDLVIDKPAAGYLLLASAEGLNGAVSGTFTVNIGPPQRLWAYAPSDGSAGAPLSTPIVAVMDAAWNVVPSANLDITLDLLSDSGDAVLEGTRTVRAVDGYATFDSLFIRRAGQYRLAASASGVTGDSSETFMIGAGAPTGFVFTVQPSTVAGGQVITPPVEVTLMDGWGNRCTNARSFGVMLTITPGTGTTGALLGGTTKLGGLYGIGFVRFDDLTVDLEGTGYTLTATSTYKGEPVDRYTGVSAAFSVTPALPSR